MEDILKFQTLNSDLHTKIETHKSELHELRKILKKKTEEK